MGITWCDQKAARDCYLRACKKIGEKDMRVHYIAERASKEDSVNQPEPVVELEKVVLEAGWTDRKVKIGTRLSEEIRVVVIRVLREYRLVFAWGIKYVPSVDRLVIMHLLAVDPTSNQVKQKKRYLSTDQWEFVKNKVSMFVVVGHVREVKYPEWLTNMVLAPKPPTWRMCVDYTGLNKVCPMDHFLLPRINLLVDETLGCVLFSFMDAFRGYHQISMHEGDEEKTTFITLDGVLCYLVMVFRLNSSGSSYTRMVAKLLGKLFEKSIEAYVDDMLVKSQEEATHENDLATCFQIMTKFKLRLNPKKCGFAVLGGKFFRYMVTQRRIVPNP